MILRNICTPPPSYIASQAEGIFLHLRNGKPDLGSGKRPFQIKKETECNRNSSERQLLYITKTS